MYIPDAFAVTDEAEVETVLQGLTLGCLVTHDEDGLFASHLPFLYDPTRRVLTGHVARPNPHWRRGSGEALVIFQGVEAYVSPSWYPSKYQHGRVVPTWNYEAVHVYGRLAWREEPDWLREHLGALTDRYEGGRVKPWGLDDAPDDYIDSRVRMVVGLELAVERVEAKRKLSQNRVESDRLGVIAGLSGSESAADRAVAAAIQAAKRE